jgi:hemoglobin
VSTIVSKTLYERLGGREGIHAIVTDLVELHRINPIVGPRFRTSNVEKLQRLAHEFFCAGAGGPEKYTGRDLREAHAGMNISEQEYLAVMDDVVQAMSKHGIEADAHNEVVAILFSLKGQIIRV